MISMISIICVQIVEDNLELWKMGETVFALNVLGSTKITKPDTKDGGDR